MVLSVIARNHDNSVILAKSFVGLYLSPLTVKAKATRKACIWVSDEGWNFVNFEDEERGGLKHSLAHS